MLQMHQEKGAVATSLELLHLHGQGEIYAKQYIHMQRRNEYPTQPLNLLLSNSNYRGSCWGVAGESGCTVT